MFYVSYTQSSHPEPGEAEGKQEDTRLDNIPSQESSSLKSAPGPSDFLLEKLELPSLEKAIDPDEALPKTRPVAYYHWVHIKDRVDQLIRDLEEKILDKNPSNVVIHLEGVGGEPLGRLRESTRFTHLINESRWLTRPYLAFTDWITRLTSSPHSAQGDSVRMQSHLLKELGKLHDRTGTHIRLNYVDIHNYDPEVASLILADRSQLQQTLMYSLDVETIDSLVHRTGNYPDTRSFLSEFVNRALVDMRTSLTERDAVVAKQLRSQLESASTNELHAVLTGAGHKSVARIIPGHLRNRVAVALSPELLDFLPDEFRTVSLGCPYSYAVERLISHPDQPEQRDTNIVLFGNALQGALRVFLSTSSEVYHTMKQGDQSDLARLLACNLTVCMSDKDLEFYTQRLFDGIKKHPFEAIHTALQREALTLLFDEIPQQSFPLSPLAKKVLRSLEMQYPDDF